MNILIFWYFVISMVRDAEPLQPWIEHAQIVPTSFEFSSEPTRFKGPAGGASFVWRVGRTPQGTDTLAAPPRSRISGRALALPAFLTRSLLFQPHSPELTPITEQSISVTAAWLRVHPQIRVVVAGFCDPLGSEQCTHELAEKRAVAVRQSLLKHGVLSSQIVGVRAWDKAGPVCEATTPSCQGVNRRARIFLAGSGLAD